MKIQEDLYLVETLYRIGNMTSPRLDHVREQDIAILYRSGKAVVLPNTGGIFVFNKIHPRLRGIWWRCPAGTAYPEKLSIVCDRNRAGLRHYIIQPAFPMELEEYQAVLRKFAESFERIEKGD